LTGKRLGTLFSYLARLEIIELTPMEGRNKDEQGERLHKGEIAATYRGVHVGDEILPYVPMSDCVQPVLMEQEMISSIVAIKDRRVILGEHQVIYLGHGQEHGIRRGNLFEILENQPTRYDAASEYPRAVLGHLLVLQTRPATATGIIVESRKEFPNGSVVRGLGREKVEHLLARLPQCEVP
jgi:hypothetical protein